MQANYVHQTERHVERKISAMLRAQKCSTMTPNSVHSLMAHKQRPFGWPSRILHPQVSPIRDAAY